MKYVIVLFVVIVCFYTSITCAADLLITHFEQDFNTGWCWAACTQMTLYYYTSPIVQQCTIVKEACALDYLSGIGCLCGSVDNCCPTFNKILCARCGLEPGNTSNWLSYVNFSFHYMGGYLSYDKIQEEIDLTNPIWMGISYILGNHLCIIGGFSVLEGEEWVRVLDPADSDEYFKYDDIKNYNGGSWFSSWIISGYSGGPLVGFDDIQSFYLDHIEWFYGWEVWIYLGFGVHQEANPSDSATVYIADNPLGPARRIDYMTYKAIPGKYNHEALDIWRPWYNSEYFYYLMHGSGSFPDICDLLYLYSNYDNPINLNGFDEHRQFLDSPNDVFVIDTPLDYGNALTISWGLSEDDTLLDCYNVYRRDTMEGYSGQYSYLTSLPPGTNSLIDSSVVGGIGASFAYKISSAHHGNESYLPGSGYFGLWNDFSMESNVCELVNNYFLLQYELACNDTLTVCPAGDADTIRVQVTVTGSDDSPTANIPAGCMFLYILQDSLYNCTSDTIQASADTDENGQSEFVFSEYGGHGHIQITASVDEIQLEDTLTVMIKSPDYTSNGYVDIVDYGLFNNAMSSNCGDANYNEWFDFDNNCTINLVDYVIFCDHWQHTFQ